MNNRLAGKVVILTYDDLLVTFDELISTLEKATSPRTKV
jgi:hypothetical protein